MPVKRRISKRRTRTTLATWELVFDCGYDFFGDLEDLGLHDPSNLRGADREAASKVWHDTLREAWAEHGAEFMRTWEPTESDPLPWAAVKFGLPEELEAATCR